MNAPLRPSPTPILSLEAPLPPPRNDGLTTIQQIFIVCLFASGIVVPIVTASAITQDAAGEGNTELPFFLSLVFLGTPAMWLVLTSIHEAGHIFSGLVMGFRFEAVEIGPLRIERSLNGWQVRSCGPIRALAAGQTEMVLDRLRQVRKRTIIMFLGGPAATVPFLIAALIATALARNPVLFLVSLSFGLCAVVHLIANVIPVTTWPYLEGGNDYTFLRALLRSREDATRMIASAVLHMLKKHHVDEIRWNPRWIRMAYPKEYLEELEVYNSEEASTESKAECLERWLASSGRYRSEERDGLILEAAFFIAWYWDDREKAHVWFSRISRPEDLGRYRILCAQIARYCANEQFEKALKAWDQGLEVLRTHSQPWVSAIEPRWISWRTEIETRKAAC
jgi:hypothetical protein